MLSIAQSTKYLCGIVYAALILFSAPSLAGEFPPKDAIPLSVPLTMDGRERGMAQMLIMPKPEESYVQAAPVIAALKPILAEDKLKALEAAISNGFLKLTDGAKGGVTLRFDETLIAIDIDLPAEHKKQQTYSARSLYDLSGKTITPPSDVSAYVNLFGSQDYVESGVTEATGRQPLRLSSDGAFNLRGVVLESSGNYIENDSHPFQRGDTRLVYDLPDSMVRVAAGDLSYPVEGFQSFQSMAGITLARDFDLQPYRVSEPTGQTSFFLNSPSRVDIYVNDRKVQTLQLDAGPFDVRNFPVVNGSNDVRLVITDASGRVEVKNFSIVSDAELLEAGLNKYA
ncbi:MAG: fimbria/pilus outer membrane usher protein, partial [Pseudomonadota bacterium]|nr:fimbria/pilus outer membrane usher protein [Pseudomonadota bacterium]